MSTIGGGGGAGTNVNLWATGSNGTPSTSVGDENVSVPVVPVLPGARLKERGKCWPFGSRPPGRSSDVTTGVWQPLPWSSRSGTPSVVLEVTSRLTGMVSGYTVPSTA